MIWVCLESNPLVLLPLAPVVDSRPRLMANGRQGWVGEWMGKGEGGCKCQSSSSRRLRESRCVWTQATGRGRGSLSQWAGVEGGRVRRDRQSGVWSSVPGQR